MTGEPGAAVNIVSAVKLGNANLTTDHFKNTTEGCLRMYMHRFVTQLPIKLTEKPAAARNAGIKDIVEF